MPPSGIECPTCKRMRAPALAACPYCRAEEDVRRSAVPDAPVSLEETVRPLFSPSDDADGSLASFPSRVVLSLLPLLIGLAAFEVIAMRGGRPHAYASGATPVALVGLSLSAVIAIGFYVLGDRLGRRVRIDGEAQSRIALGIVALVGVLPAAWLPIDRWVDQANAFGGDLTPVSVPCTWSVARQARDAGTGALLQVTLEATCTTPDGDVLPVEMSLEAASIVNGSSVVVPMWRGRWFGWLYTLDLGATMR